MNDAENCIPDIATDGAFTITLDLKYAPFMDIEDDLNIAKVIMGVTTINYTAYV